MNTIVRFIVRYQFFLLFLVLEAISFWMLGKHTYYQNSKFEDAYRVMSGHANQCISNATSYFSLKDVNDNLAQENLELKNRLALLNAKYDALSNLLYDTLVSPGHNYTLARVVNNSVNKQYNYITLNVGAKNGICKEMGVITSQGIVGVVVGVSNHFCTVISLLNVDLKISAKLRSTNHFGSLFWNGTNYREVVLTDIPQHANINLGDTIVTSGYSSIFPADIELGTVSSIDSKDSNFHSLTVRLFLDFKQLNTVWAVSHKFENEQGKLESMLNN